MLTVRYTSTKLCGSEHGSVLHAYLAGMVFSCVCCILVVSMVVFCRPTLLEWYLVVCVAYWL